VRGEGGLVQGWADGSAGKATFCLTVGFEQSGSSQFLSSERCSEQTSRCVNQLEAGQVKLCESRSVT
jgi:hypothetical protein